MRMLRPLTGLALAGALATGCHMIPGGPGPEPAVFNEADYGDSSGGDPFVAPNPSTIVGTLGGSDTFDQYVVLASGEARATCTLVSGAPVTVSLITAGGVASGGCNGSTLTTDNANGSATLQVSGAGTSTYRIVISVLE